MENRNQERDKAREEKKNVLSSIRYTKTFIFFFFVVKDKCKLYLTID